MEPADASRARDRNQPLEFRTRDSNPRLETGTLFGRIARPLRHGQIHGKRLRARETLDRRRGNQQFGSLEPQKRRGPGKHAYASLRLAELGNRDPERPTTLPSSKARQAMAPGRKADTGSWAAMGPEFGPEIAPVEPQFGSRVPTTASPSARCSPVASPDYRPSCPLQRASQSERTKFWPRVDYRLHTWLLRIVTTK